MVLELVEFKRCLPIHATSPKSAGRDGGKDELSPKFLEDLIYVVARGEYLV